jgi:hypothetical protein
MSGTIGRVGKFRRLKSAVLPAVTTQIEPKTCEGARRRRDYGVPKIADGRSRSERSPGQSGPKHFTRSAPNCTTEFLFLIGIAVTALLFFTVLRARRNCDINSAGADINFT